MGNPVDSSQFAKLLEARLYEVAHEREKYHEMNDIIPQFYHEITDSIHPFEEFTGIAQVPDLTPFSGRLTDLGIYPTYSTRIEPGQYGGMVTMERKLIDDQKFGLLEDVSAGLIDAAYRVRQKNAIRPFIYATSTAFDFMQSEEGIALAGNHLTKVPGVSTSTGFANFGTSAMNPTSIAATRINMRRFRTSIGERYNVGDNFGIICPDSLVFKAQEIVGTDKGLYSAEGTKNVHKNRYQVMPLMRWDDYSTTNWALVDLNAMKKMLIWIQRAKAETKRTVDFNTLETKQSCYERHGYGFIDWRWIYFHTVS